MRCVQTVSNELILEKLCIILAATGIFKLWIFPAHNSKMLYEKHTLEILRCQVKTLWRSDENLQS